MVTFLITSFFILALAAIVIYFWQKPAAPTGIDLLPPPPGRGLFIDGTSEGRALVLADAQEQAIAAATQERAELLERAKNGDKSTLQEAIGNKQLYEEALNLLVAGADSDHSTGARHIPHVLGHGGAVPLGAGRRELRLLYFQRGHLRLQSGRYAVPDE